MIKYHLFRGEDPQIQSKAVAVLNLSGAESPLRFEGRDGDIAGVLRLDPQLDIINLETDDGTTVENLVVDEFESGSFGIRFTARSGEKTYNVVVWDFPEQDDYDPELDDFGTGISREMKLRALANARMKFSCSYLAGAFGDSMGDEMETARQTRASMRNMLTVDFFRSLGDETLAALGFRFVRGAELKLAGFESAEASGCALALFPADIFFLLPNSFKGYNLAGTKVFRGNRRCSKSDFQIPLISCVPFGIIVGEN